MTYRVNDPLATAAVEAIQTGNVEALKRVLEAKPSLASGRIDGQRTLLHVATDWPGHFPNCVASVAALVAYGADVNAPFVGRHTETPLHWAASTDDVEVLDMLLGAGADIEARGGVIGGGAPLADAVAFGQWQAARRLVDHGAMTTLWQAAALGLMERLERCFTPGQLPSQSDITNAFWCACHGGQLGAAEYLLKRGADLNWVGHDGLTPLDAARRSNAASVTEWLCSKGAESSKGAD